MTPRTKIFETWGIPQIEKSCSGSGRVKPDFARLDSTLKGHPPLVEVCLPGSTPGKGEAYYHKWAKIEECILLHIFGVNFEKFKKTILQIGWRISVKGRDFVICKSSLENYPQDFR